MRPALITFLFVATAACARASTGVSCPVNITASQLNSGKTVWTISDEDEKLSKQPGAHSDGAGIHVSLHALAKNGVKIKQVSLQVYFAQPGLHYLPTTPSSNAPSSDKTADLKKTFHLAAADGASEQLAGDLLVGQTAGIKRVSVTSIVFTSGYTWQDWSGSSCSVEPNHFMPVQVK